MSVSESTMSPYEQMFGTPERVADFVVSDCNYDCMSCPFNGVVCDYGDCWSKKPDKWRDGIIKRLRGVREV